MKRKVFFAAVGTAAAAVGLVCASALWAQPGAAPKPPAPAAPAAAAPAPAAPVRTRIALLNLTYVIKNYEKYKSYQKDMNVALEDFNKRADAKRAEAKGLETTMSDPTKTPAERETAGLAMKKVQRDMEDINLEAKKFLGKKSDEQMVILYREIQDAARRYAQSNNYDLVLHFNEATTQEDYNSPANVARKMQAGACMPLYYANGMDISYDVVNSLNAAYSPAHPTTGGAPATHTP